MTGIFASHVSTQRKPWIVALAVFGLDLFLSAWIATGWLFTIQKIANFFFVPQIIMIYIYYQQGFRAFSKSRNFSKDWRFWGLR